MNTTSSSRILIVKLSSLGDLFHALPAVHALRRGCGARVDWVTQDAYVDLVKCFEDVERVIPFPRHAFWRRLPPFLKALRAQSYELIVDLQGLLKSAMVARLARGARRIGPSFHREGAGLLYPEVAGPPDRNRHAVEEAMDVVRYLRLPAGEIRFPVRCPPFPVKEPAPRVALAPFSRWPSKNWPMPAYVALAKTLLARGQASLYLLGGPEDAPAGMRLEKALSGRVVNWAGKLTLVQMAGALREMQLAVGNDSGPIHMAAALGVPALALYGPTDPRRTGPYGPGHRVLEYPLLCRPCFSAVCRHNDQACLKNLGPDTVADAALEMLHQHAIG